MNAFIEDLCRWQPLNREQLGRLDSLLSECDQVMDDAAFGQTIHDLDGFLLIAGKKFLQEVFQQKLQERIEQVQQQPETKRCPQCKKT